MTYTGPDPDQPCERCGCDECGKPDDGNHYILRSRYYCRPCGRRVIEEYLDA